MTEEYENELLQAAARAAIEARPARPDDDPSEVMVLGKDFFYLGEDHTGQILKYSQREGAPERVVIDADSFLSGLVPTETTFLALREPDGLPLKINVVAAETESQ